MSAVQFDIKLSKAQQEVYDMVHRKDLKYITVVFSRQSGKTVLMLCLVIEWLINKNANIAYVCRNYILAKKLYRQLVKILPKDFIKNANGSDFFIESVYGGQLTFFSAESGASLRGQTFTHMICDEFAFFKMEQTDGTHLWNDILSPTVKAQGEKVVFVSTPLGKQNMLYEMYLRGLSPEYPKYGSILKTIYDDGFITPDGIEDIKKSIPEMSFRSEYLCEFLDGALTFFTGFENCFENFRYTASTEWVGIDVSANGEDATVVARINDKNEVKVEKIDGTLDKKYEKIANIINRINPNAVYFEVNGIGAPMYNEVQKLLRNKNRMHGWTTTNESKEEIITDLAVEIANKNIHFDSTDTELYGEFGTFIAKISKTKKLTFGAQNGRHDDMVMAVAMALKCKKDYRRNRNNNNTFITAFGSRGWAK